MRAVLFLSWLLLCLGLFALHFVHLRADFPNHSRWREWAKYTDEGWYGNAAVRLEIRTRPASAHLPATFIPPSGTPAWHLDGDFNPAVALPVWPLLLAGVFHFTGISVAAARALSVAIFGCNCFLLYALMRRLGHSAWAGLGVVTIALCSMYWFVFDRLAILEPLASCFLLGGFWLVLELREQPKTKLRMAKLGLLGVLCGLLLLTKTTGVFLLPGIFVLLRPAGAFRDSVRPWLRDATITAASLAVFYGGYFLLVWHAGYAEDFRYLFTSNIYPRPTSAAGWLNDGWQTVRAMLCMGVILPWVTVATTVLRLLLRRRLPAFEAAVCLAVFVYLFFIFLHNNPQPRYYMPVALLFMLLSVSGAVDLLGRAAKHRTLGQAAGAIALLLLAIAGVSGLREITRYLRRPEYSLVDAAQAVTRYIDAHPNGNRLLLSTSGDEISLMTGLPAICDDYGPWDLADRIAYYQPGWFAAWNDIDYGALVDIHTHDWLELAASFPATDDPDRSVLNLYKLHPLPGHDVGVPPEEEQPGPPQ